jgi:FtsH-binding integral membrane protein
MSTNDTKNNRSRRAIVLVLLVAPFIGTLWVSTYNHVAPDFAGIPFFYWYLFLWVLISAVLTLVAYLLTRRA